MTIIGITGGIGSGKSSVCEVIGKLGYPVYNSDVAAKRLMHSDASLIRVIKLEFGVSIYKDDKLDRNALADVVFKNPDKLKSLNAEVHPAVARDFEEWCLAQKTEMVFKEAAILFETGGDKQMDKTILIHAPMQERIERVIKRDGVTEDAILSRMTNQWSDERKIPLADYVIENHSDHLIIPQILEVVKGL
ncbi:MAG: dephospho-CoA kinase [Flavobacteriales bacterium]|jgi:dephospho-CoA kinase